MDESKSKSAIGLPEGYSSWNDYWTKVHDQTWRTEPEIPLERQQFLAERRAIKPDYHRGIFPFTDGESNIKLTRADLEWLLATHVWKGKIGPIRWEDEIDKYREDRSQGIDLRGADLRGLDLRNLPLTCLIASGEVLYSPPQRTDRVTTTTRLEHADLRDVHLEFARLAYTHLERAWLDGAHLEGANLFSAHLEHAQLTNTHLECAHLGWSYLEEALLYGSYMQHASLAEAHAERADFSGSTGGYLAKAHENGEDGGCHLEGANLRSAHLEGADLWSAHLEGANLSEAHLEGALLRKAHLGGAPVPTSVGKNLMIWDDLIEPPTIWQPADLSMAFLDRATQLNDIDLGSDKYGFALLADVNWGDANLAVVNWRCVKMIGNEKRALLMTDSDGELKDAALRVQEFDEAKRGYRQVAMALRQQGLNEEADGFAYRAQILRRSILWRESKRFSALNSFLLDLISGYGYKPMRSLVSYVVIILLFAGAYLLNAQFAAPHLTWDEAIVLSISAFHGRGFFTSGISLGDTLARLAALEAIIGLIIEITFIATFTQRFFAR